MADQPRTANGREFLELLEKAVPSVDKRGFILAIEAEAAAPAEELREALASAIEDTLGPPADGTSTAIRRAIVDLALARAALAVPQERAAGLPTGVMESCRKWHRGGVEHYHYRRRAAQPAGEPQPSGALREALERLVGTVQRDAGTFPWNPDIEQALDVARAALAVPQERAGLPPGVMESCRKWHRGGVEHYHYRALAAPQPAEPQP